MSDLQELLSPRSSAGVAVAANGHPGFVFRKIWEWTSYPDEQPILSIKRTDPETDEELTEDIPAPWWREEYVGFRARLMVNPSGAELRHEQALHTQLTRLLLEEADYLESIAYRVIEWDVVVVDQDENRHPIPSPGEDGWERFLDLPPLLMSWLCMEIRHAHLPKARRPLASRAGPTDSTIPSTPPPTSETEPPPS